jgi:hypothetical protein
MSVLGNQVFANTTTPCWLSSGGGTITGGLTVTGEVVAGQGLVTFEGAGLGGLEILNAAGTAQVSRIQHLPGGSPRTIVQSTDPIFFNQIGTAQGNTSLTVSAFGANTDLLVVGGTVAAQKLELDTGGAASVCGRDTIPAAATNVVIATTAVTANSIIFVSHAGAAVAGPGNGGAEFGLTVNPALIVPGVSFRVDLVDPATGIAVAATFAGGVEFTYLIIN